MRTLSQLRPRRFHSANRVFRLPGGTEDNDLWVEVHGLNDQALGETAGVTSIFEPTAEQRALIAEGANIALTVIGGQPPVMMRLTDEPLGKKPASERGVS